MDQEKNYNELTEDELLPEPEAIKTENPEFIPAPEAEDEYLPDITEEMVREEMLGVSEEGYSRCMIVADLSKLEKFNPETDAVGADLPEDFNGEVDNLPDDKSIPVRSAELQLCKVKEYSLDGNVVNVELEFEGQYDKDMCDLLDLLDEYADMNNAFDAAEHGTADYPIFNLCFMPLKYPGQGMAIYSQPFAYFKTLPHDAEETTRIVHMLFPVERTGVQLYHARREDIENLKEYFEERDRDRQ